MVPDPHAAAQSRTGSQASIQITIGNATVHALELPREVRLPITFSPGSARAGITRLRLELGFAADLLAFVEATPGSAARLAGAKTSASARDGKKGERVLVLDIAASKPLAQGPLLALAFDVLKPAMIADAVRVEVLHRSAEDAGGNQVSPRVTGGTISIDGSPVPTCFFYMH
jgi:hypothetical protein